MKPRCHPPCHPAKWLRIVLNWVCESKKSSASPHLRVRRSPRRSMSSHQERAQMCSPGVQTHHWATLWMCRGMWREASASELTRPLWLTVEHKTSLYFHFRSQKCYFFLYWLLPHRNGSFKPIFYSWAGQELNTVDTQIKLKRLDLLYIQLCKNALNKYLDQS